MHGEEPKALSLCVALDFRTANFPEFKAFFIFPPHLLGHCRHNRFINQVQSDGLRSTRAVVYAFIILFKAYLKGYISLRLSCAHYQMNIYTLAVGMYGGGYILI